MGELRPNEYPRCRKFPGGLAAAERSCATLKAPMNEEPRGSRYVVREKIASGGMGAVYRVTDTRNGQELALKRLSSNSAAHECLLQGFEREYQVLASLDHPRIIRVFDFGVDELGAYYTMELVEGTDLRHAAPLPYRQACLYLRDVATCLALLHARRLLHRDLSPSNVRITSDGHCKLLDFGALTSFGIPDAVIGTPPVVPPEAFERSSLDQRADLYALGALGYWLLTGRHAYPARQLHDLVEVWTRPPGAPSALAPDVPAALDELILSLLSFDPLARPASAAEVIARINVLAELPVDASDAERLAESFLLNPPFTGRAKQVAEVVRLTNAAIGGHGAALRIEAASGMGRTRLLEEIGVRAQLAGATVLRVDASMHRALHGTNRALALRLFEAHAEIARRRGSGFRAPLEALGADVANRLGESAPGPPPQDAETATLEDWFASVSEEVPLTILVDNVEAADDASLGVLAALANLSANRALLVVVTLRTAQESEANLGLAAFQAHSSRMEVPPLEAAEVSELASSLFNDAPNVKRFSEWLHGRAAGSPLHVVEIVRQLVAKQVIRYTAGVWTLPDDRPDAELPAALEDVLSMRVALLGDAARALAECVSLVREPPTSELCRLIAQEPDDRRFFAVLGELAKHGILYAERDGYRFSSTALRDVVLAGMDEKRLEQNHRRLGESLTKIAGGDRPELRIEAGWHLIRGGQELRGADMIAQVTHDSVTIRTLVANLHRVGRPLEAALRVYARYRRSIYERLPLLSALAQAGYYEDRIWAESYGDSALDLLEHVSGLALARRLRPAFGRWIALTFGLLIAALRFQFVPRRERPCSFQNVLTQLLSSVTCLSGVAALSLDSARAERVADVLEPFSTLPERLTPVGIHQFCKGLQEIGRDNVASAHEAFETLLARFQNPRYYPSLPEDARKLYIAAMHFARGSFAIFRAHGKTALESADELDRTGLRLYTAIASQLRFLYHINRGEFAAAALHREQVELHAAHLGSVWQVETWEAPALILVSTTLSDVVTSTRLAHRLDALGARVPSLKQYARLAKLALSVSLRDGRLVDRAEAEIRAYTPRSFIGWASTMAFGARAANEIGRYSAAKSLCEETLATVMDAEREYVALFLNLDIQLAIADAGLGRFDAGRARLDGLLQRFDGCDHPLVHGLLHEARARICFAAGELEEYERSRAAVEHWFLPTGTPVLVAKCKRLGELKNEPHFDGYTLPILPSLGGSSDDDLDAFLAPTQRTGHALDPKHPLPRARPAVP